MNYAQGRNQEIILAKQSQWVGIICPFPVEIGLTIFKIRARQMLGCLTIDYAPAYCYSSKNSTSQGKKNFVIFFVNSKFVKTCDEQY